MYWDCLRAGQYRTLYNTEITITCIIRKEIYLGKETEEGEMAGAKGCFLLEEPRRKGAINIILK